MNSIGSVSRSRCESRGHRERTAAFWTLDAPEYDIVISSRQCVRQGSAAWFNALVGRVSTQMSALPFSRERDWFREVFVSILNGESW